MSDSTNRYTIKRNSDQPGQKFKTSDLEDAVETASSKADNVGVPFRIIDNKKEEIAGVVKPNGEIVRTAKSVLGKSQNPAINSGVIKIDKEALRAMIKETVARKLGNPINETAGKPKVHKVTKSQLAEVIEKVTRNALREVSNPGLGAYASKVDKLVADSIDGIDKLVEEGEELMKENPTHDYAIQERNHLIQARIGILKGLKTQLVSIMEHLYKKI